MNAQFLHIIAFNIPYPPDYGGVIEIYYKLKALSSAGVRIILHCFEYGRLHSKELEELCFRVYYYPRASGWIHLLQASPYIVVTRNAKSMPERLLEDPFPVLFEGLHTTAVLPLCAAAGKRTLVRAHNIEHAYYSALSRSERNLSTRLFLRTEARKLKKYEKVLKHADHILGISKLETAYFEESYGHAWFVPAFHRYDQVISLEGSGNYILFHGNLGIAENALSFLRLARRTLSRLPYQVVVAGKDPSRRFQQALASWSNIRVVANPGDPELEQLIQQAHINLLVSAQSTGAKLKLLHALYAGRHCLVNPAMVRGTGLESLCTVPESDRDMEAALQVLMQQEFPGEEILKRKKALKEYSNRAGAEKILRLLD